MKKLIFTLAVALGVFASTSAQEAGKMWVGGQVGFGVVSPDEGDNTTSFVIMPEFGYVLQDNLGLGINVGYAHSKTGDDKSDGFIVNPFVRYSFLKGNIGGLFVDGGVGYAHTKENDIKTDAIEVGFRPGVAVTVTDKIALTAKFGFLGYEYEKEGDAKSNSFGFDFDMRNCLLGVSYVF